MSHHPKAEAAASTEAEAAASTEGVAEPQRNSQFGEAVSVIKKRILEEKGVASDSDRTTSSEGDSSDSEPNTPNRVARREVREEGRQRRMRERELREATQAGPGTATATDGTDPLLPTQLPLTRLHPTARVLVHLSKKDLPKVDHDSSAPREQEDRAEEGPGPRGGSEQEELVDFREVVDEARKDPRFSEFVKWLLEKDLGSYNEDEYKEMIETWGDEATVHEMRKWRMWLCTAHPSVSSRSWHPHAYCTADSINSFQP